MNEQLLNNLIACLVFGVVGIGLAALGFKVFDWMTPRVRIQQELADKQNLAVAIVMAAVILGTCYIVAHIVGAPTPTGPAGQ